MEDPDAAAHAVLFSQDLLAHGLWPWLDVSSKKALRGVCSAMRRQVDVSIVVVTSPGEPWEAGPSAAELAAALQRWPSVTELTLMGVCNAASTLAPLATAALKRLTSLTLRAFEFAAVVVGDAWDAPGRMPVLSNNLAATLQVIDISCCYGITSINTVGSCAQLKCLRMPGVSVRDLAPLAACSQLEELWMAGSFLVTSLEPLTACPRLRRLDLRGCRPSLHDQVEDLQLACTQLADPSSVELEGLVHDLQPSMMHFTQERAARRLRDLANSSAQNQSAIAAAGAIPPLVRILCCRRYAGDTMVVTVLCAAAGALGCLAESHAQIQATIAAAQNQATIPRLVQLLGPQSLPFHEAAARALRSLAYSNAENQTAIAAAGAIPPLVQMLGPQSLGHVKLAAVRALEGLAVDHAQNQATIVTAGAIPRLLDTRGAPEVQVAAGIVLRMLGA
ncbi:hypothetical protein FOA52_013610 [Chlamydomonas sp. UWO 241]|nr:hypothetical protein FOA52_013610 [Chlamydomonas sp. UWO 241]